MIALAFFAGIFMTAAVAILIVRGAKAPPCPGAEFHETPNRIDFRALHGPMPLDDDRMRSLSVRTAARVQGRSMTVEEREALRDFAANYDALIAEDVRRRYASALKLRYERDADFWDIANHETEPESGRVEYRFLGITGFEDD